MCRIGGVFFAGLAIALAGCPGSQISFDSGVATDAGDAGTFDAGLADAGLASSGVLIGGPGAWPGPIAGLYYRSGDLTGVTDADGGFSYRPGQPLLFQIGDIVFPPVTGAPQLSVWQLAGERACSLTPAVERAAVLLYSLGQDTDLAKVLTLPSVPVPSTARGFTTLSMSDIHAAVAQFIAGRQALEAAAAIDVLLRQVEDESWEEVGHDSFAGAPALRRGQGVATDGTSWYFSGSVSLEKTDLSYQSLATNLLAIPTSLYFTKGIDHIGDVDVASGILYVPLEDESKGYRSPMLARFDLNSLSLKDTFSISTELQSGGVPWVAADTQRQRLVVAEWDPTTQLNFFDLANVTFHSSLGLRPPLGVTLGRIQGAGFLEGALYLSSDDSAKSVYKVIQETGTVLRVVSIATKGEIEGMAFLPRPDGTAMHVLNLTENRSGLEFRHLRRTRLPLRAALCH